MPTPSTRPGVRRVTLAAATVLAAALAPLHASADTEAHTRPGSQADSSCFWTGPFTADSDKLNFAYLDTNALYWSSNYTLPQGAKLTLNGAYAHARYQSLNSYDATTAAPLTALNDQQIQPDPGSRNPYLAGAKRTYPKRSWTVQVSPDTPPKDPTEQVPNTLYAGQPSSTAQAVMYRVYVPDHGRDATGGVGLPTPTVTMADGTRLTGQALCDALKPDPDALGPRVTPLNDYLKVRDQPGKPVGFPAEDPVEWHASYTPAWIRQCEYEDKCTPAPARSVGQYSNLDNAYVSTRINRELGPVVVLHGKVPTTPRTGGREPRMGSGQLRYWSLCAYEAWSTRVDGPQSCLYDEQLHPDAHGNYTVVVSRPGDRPKNATAACGVDWIAWPKNGDGAGDLDDAMLLLRNMLPAKGFTQAPQNTRTGDDEAQVMGPYLPTGHNTTTTAFDQQDCSTRHAH
ncbi:hypothetical protein [Streptomyces sp. NPDC055400]